MRYAPAMKTSPLAEILTRAERWPPHLQNELADFARELEAGVNGGAYHPTLAQLAGIDRGLRTAEAGRFASDDAVEAVLVKHRYG
jgi:hypothetical protein